MDKILLSALTASMLVAGGDITPKEPKVELAPTDNSLGSAFKNGKVSGQIRAG